VCVCVEYDNSIFNVWGNAGGRRQVGKRGMKAGGEGASIDCTGRICT
jgi:hypothetical protein